MISKHFIKSSLIYTIAGTLPMASAFILLPFYIHYLSTETLGAMWIYLAVSVLVQIVVTFSFDSSLYVYYHEFKNSERKRSVFISSAFMLMLMIGACVAVLFSVTGNYIFELIYKDQIITFYPYGLIAIFIGISQAFFKVYSSLLQTQQKPALFFRSNLLSFSLIAGLTILGLKFYPGSLVGPLTGRLIAAIIAGGWAFFRIVRTFGFHFNYPLLHASFSFNFYAFIYQLQSWLVNYFDRIVISLFLPLQQVGIYGFAVSCLLMIDFAVNGLYSTFAPKIIGIIMDQERKMATPEINRYFNGLTVMAMLMVSGCILLFPVIIENFIAKPDYKLSIQFLPYVGIIYLFKSMRLYFGIPYGILKYTKPLPVIYAVVAAVKIGGMFLLLKYIGIYGVILSSLLSYWIEVILLYSNGKSRFDFKFNGYKMIVAPVTLAVLVAFAESLSGILNPFLIHAFYFIACFILVFWAFRNEIRLINPLKFIK